MQPPKYSDSHSAVSAAEIRAAKMARRQARYYSPGSSGSEHHTPPRRRAPRVRRTARIRWNTIWSTLFFIGSAVMSVFFLIIGSLVLADYRWIQAQVEDKEKQLAALNQQREIGRRRLAVLTSPAGREQLLLERGYLKPGDRFLLFPTTPEEERAAAIPKNDLSPHPPSMQVGEADDSAWQRAGRSLGRWWQRFSSEETSATPLPQQ